LKIKIKLTSKKTKNDKTYTTRLLNKFLKKKKKKAKKKKKTYFFSSFYYEALEQVGN
jgi:Ulp1 family protease